ncbi:hypothetical protein TRVL_04985 [Trypanosoma vivax]|nr:hypothetical protein TRVL_04985 [Trypanosoma vivax]
MGVAGSLETPGTIQGTNMGRAAGDAERASAHGHIAGGRGTKRHTPGARDGWGHWIASARPRGSSANKTLPVRTAASTETQGAASKREKMSRHRIEQMHDTSNGAVTPVGEEDGWLRSDDALRRECVEMPVTWDMRMTLFGGCKGKEEEEGRLAKDGQAHLAVERRAVARVAAVPVRDGAPARTPTLSDRDGRSHEEYERHRKRHQKVGVERTSEAGRGGTRGAETQGSGDTAGRERRRNTGVGRRTEEATKHKRGAREDKATQQGKAKAHSAAGACTADLPGDSAPVFVVVLCALADDVSSGLGDKGCGRVERRNTRAGHGNGGAVAVGREDRKNIEWFQAQKKRSCGATR